MDVTYEQKLKQDDDTKAEQVNMFCLWGMYVTLFSNHKRDRKQVRGVKQKYTSLPIKVKGLMIL